MRDPPEPFETWLLHRVAEAVEGNEVSAELLTDLHAAIAEVRARSPEARDAIALMDLAERVNLPVDEPTELLATLEPNPLRRGSGFCGDSWRHGWSSNGRRTTRSNAEVRVTKGLEGRQAVPLEEVDLAQAFQLEALMNVLERRGVVWKAEVLEGRKRLKAKTPKVR